MNKLEENALYIMIVVICILLGIIWSTTLDSSTRIDELEERLGEEQGFESPQIEECETSNTPYKYKFVIQFANKIHVYDFEDNSYLIEGTKVPEPFCADLYLRYTHIEYPDMYVNTTITHEVRK